MVVGIAFAAVIALTVYLEVQHQGAQEEKPAPSVNSGKTEIAETEPVTVIPAGLNPYDLPDADSRGATMLTLYCAQCHELPSPSMHSRSEWENVLTRMNDHMQSTRGGMLRRVLIPPEKDWETLQAYMYEYAQLPLDKNTTSGLGSPAGKAFEDACSQCHGAPNPGTHTASEWPRVVLRMKSHITRTGKSMPDQDTLLKIIDYLQKHGKTTS
ncbi:hypothetical protein [Kaarinaea lacus]